VERGRLVNAALLADAVLALHLAYVAFTVGGELAVLLGALLRWRWIRNRTFRLTHLAAVALVAAESLVGALCPLTVWEYRLREAAGDAIGERAGLVARIIRALIYHDFPDWFFVALYVFWTCAVLLTLVAIPPIAPRARSRTAGSKLAGLPRPAPLGAYTVSRHPGRVPRN
jgi:hypothetical protein